MAGASPVTCTIMQQFEWQVNCYTSYLLNIVCDRQGVDAGVKDLVSRIKNVDNPRRFKQIVLRIYHLTNCNQKVHRSIRCCLLLRTAALISKQLYTQYVRRLQLFDNEYCYWLEWYYRIMRYPYRFYAHIIGLKRCVHHVVKKQRKTKQMIAVYEHCLGGLCRYVQSFDDKASIEKQIEWINQFIVLHGRLCVLFEGVGCDKQKDVHVNNMRYLYNAFTSAMEPQSKRSLLHNLCKQHVNSIGCGFFCFVLFGTLLCMHRDSIHRYFLRGKEGFYVYYVGPILQFYSFVAGRNEQEISVEDNAMLRMNKMLQQQKKELLMLQCDIQNYKISTYKSTMEWLQKEQQSKRITDLQIKKIESALQQGSCIPLYEYVTSLPRGIKARLWDKVPFEKAMWYGIQCWIFNQGESMLQRLRALLDISESLYMHLHTVVLSVVSWKQHTIVQVLRKSIALLPATGTCWLVCYVIKQLHVASVKRNVIVVRYFLATIEQLSINQSIISDKQYGRLLFLLHKIKQLSAGLVGTSDITWYYFISDLHTLACYSMTCEKRQQYVAAMRHKYSFLLPTM